MNAEFQGTARRDEKALFSDQCKEIEENDRMGRYQGNISRKDGLDKGQNGIDLIEAEDIKKRWQKKKRGGKNIQKNCTKKIFTPKIIKKV